MSLLGSQVDSVILIDIGLYVSLFGIAYFFSFLVARKGKELVDSSSTYRSRSFVLPFSIVVWSK